MSPESQAAQTARLQEQMANVLERERETAAAISNFRHLLSDTSTVATVNTERMRAVEDDVTDIKRILRELQERCVTKADIERLEAALGNRQQMSTGRFAALMAFLSAVVVAFIGAAVQILGSVPH